MKMDFSVGLGRGDKAEEIADLAKTAEECGFSQMTFVDQPTLDRDLHVMMTLAALNTRRIKIGHGVTDPFTFHPSVIANATATIHELSGGRAFIGIGAGGPFGKVMKPRPLSELREAVLFLKKYTSGEEAEFKGSKMHSEWVRGQIPVYIACTHGSKSLEMAGELGDGVIMGDSHPQIVRWRMEQIARGAERAGRDPSKIDVWVRTEILVAKSKKEAHREVSSYAATWARARYWSLQRKTPEAAELAERMETVEPGILDELKKIHDAWTPSQHEVLDAPVSRLVSQRLVDFNYLTGTPDDICERIPQLGKLGVTNMSTVTFTIVDKKGMMREISNRIMPHFPN